MSESKPSNFASATTLDTIVPVLTHTPVTSAQAGLPLTLYADATDNVGVQSVTLFFRAIGQTNFTSRARTRKTGSRWFATIEGSRVMPPGLQYYIEATDGISTVRSVSPSFPHTVAVTDQPVITSVTPNHGSSAGGTAVTISGANFRTNLSVLIGGGVAGDLVRVSANELRGTTPAHYPAVVDVVVTNWGSASGMLVRGFTYDSDLVTVSLPNTGGAQYDTVQVPVGALDAQGLAAADLTITFNSAVLRGRGARAGTLTPGWSVVANTNTPGQLRLSLASNAGTVAGSGSLALLEFDVVGAPGTNSPLHLAAALLNGGAIGTNLMDGGFAVTVAYRVAGTVRQWASNSAVPGVVQVLNGAQMFAGVTDSNGLYSVAGVPAGAYTLTPAKSDGVNGISAFDASLVLRHAVGLTNLTGNAAVAADVDKSGTINAMDAFYILQYTVGLLPLPFPGAGGVWAFSPATRSYAALASDQSAQDFTAVLLGDVSGNWSRDLALQTQSGAMSAALVSAVPTAAVAAGALAAGELEAGPGPSEAGPVTHTESGGAEPKNLQLSGVVARWPADGNALDVVGNSHGVLRNGAGYADGCLGQAFVLDGIDDYVDISGTNYISGARTCVLWVKPNLTAGLGAPLMTFGAVGGPGDFLAMNGNGPHPNFPTMLPYEVFVDHWGVAPYRSWVSATANAWNHVAVVYSGLTVTIYLNGVPSAPVTGGLYDYSIGTLDIGGSRIGGTTTRSAFRGLIDDAAIYNRALSAAEIKDLYAEGFKPSIMLEPQSQTVIAGESVTFSVAGRGATPLAYQWYFKGAAMSGEIHTNLVRSPVQPSGAGQYLVVLSNALGSATSQVATLTVLVPPTITQQPHSQTVIVGDSATFPVLAAGSEPFAYQWSRNGAPLTGATASAWTVLATRPQDAGAYAVVVSNAAGIAASMDAVLSVQAPPLPAGTVRLAVYRGPDGAGGETARVLIASREAVIYSVELKLRCGSRVREVRAGSLAAGMMLACNTNVTGLVSSALAGATPIGGYGEVLEMILPAGYTGELTLTEAVVNEGQVPATIASAAVFDCDTDGDGVPDWLEIQAGTDPTNPLSVFKVSAGELHPDGSRSIRWLAVVGRRYQVEYKDRLEETLWQPLGEAQTAVSTVLTATDNTPYASGQRFYRVRLAE